MESTKQNAATIIYFFSSILADGTPLPRTVVTDFSKILMFQKHLQIA